MTTNPIEAKPQKRDESTIACVVTLHNEGLLAHKTLQAVQRAAQHAVLKGLKAEIIVILDRAEVQTRALIQRHWGHLHVVETNYGDPAMARNRGISASTGAYIAIIDGDDLVSKNWLTSAYAINKTNMNYILHPQYNVCFGRTTAIFQHPDQEQEDFDAVSLSTDNYWTSLCFAAWNVFVTCPYVATPSDSVYGYEDWHWNCETMYRGYVHKVVQKTAHFIRLKNTGSRNLDSAERKCIMRHSRLFQSNYYLGGVP